MIRIAMFVAVCAFVLFTCASAQDAKKAPDKKPAPPPPLTDLLKLTPEEFIKRFDKDGDGLLNRDELPPFFAKAAAASGKGENAKLNREDVAAMLERSRKAFAAGAFQPPSMRLEKAVDDLLRQFDTNKDGKISKQEAKGKLLEDFEKADVNKDGYLDRKELLVIAERLQRPGGGRPPPGFGRGFTPAVDFDDLDKNADGRLSREELKGTRWSERFDEIDTDKSGLIDRREFESYLRRDREKTATPEKKQ